MSGLIGKGKLLWVPVSWKAGSRDLSRANRGKGSCGKDSECGALGMQAQPVQGQQSQLKWV